jgi:hypothetical protein
MGTLNSIYVRATDPATVAKLRAQLPSAYTEPATEFYAIDQPVDRFRCDERQLATLSADFNTDVIWLSFQSVVDAFQFYHWQKGRHVRSLMYGCFEERTWERAEGTPEPWESVLFDARRLSWALEDSSDADERRELERIYRGRVLEPKSCHPSIDARERARDVAKHYRLPGWGLSPEPTR